MNIGGDYQLPRLNDLASEEPAWREPFLSLMQNGDLSFVDSGRSAIRLALRLLHLPEGAQVLISAYTCGTVLQAIRAEGCKPVLHPVNNDLSPKPGMLKNRPDAAVMMAYFGFAPHMEVAEHLSAAGIPLIFDLTHSWLSESVFRNVQCLAMQHGNSIIASLRKLLPVPDGGMLWTPVSANRHMFNNTPIAPHADSRMAAMLWKSQQLAQGQLLNHRYRQAFLAAERLLDTQNEIYGLSQISRHVLQVLHMESIRERRRSNYLALLEHAPAWQANARPLFSALMEGTCPMGFPLVMDSIAKRDMLFQYLFAHGVYPMLLWPLEKDAALACPIARRFSKTMLTIPCDQRYNRVDMEAVCTCIDAWQMTICS